jgi:choline dehydrogenase-like flavoprotein
VNLPVGQNLQDHVATPLGPFLISEALALVPDRDLTAKSYFEYGSQGTGPLTFSGFSATGLLASSFAIARGEPNWPDLQLTLFPTSTSDPSSFANELAHTHSLNPETLGKYYSPAALKGKHSFHIFVSLSRPAGRGEIKLASRTPTDPMVINPRYLEDPWNLDIKVMVDGIKKALRLVEGTTAFQNIGGHFGSGVIPVCETLKFRCDEYWECYTRQFVAFAFSHTNQHFIFKQTYTNITK